MSFQQNLSRLLEIFDEPPNEGHEAVYARRARELDKLLNYSEEVKEKHQKRKKRANVVFPMLGLLFAGLTAGAVVWNIPGLRDLMHSGWDSFLTVSGIALAGIAGFFTYNILRANPLRDLRQKMSNLRDKFMKTTGLSRDKKRRGSFERSVSSDGLYRSRRNKIIAGVAGGIAEYIGVNAGVIRFLFLVGLFATSGGLMIPYLILAMFLSFPPHQEEY